MGFFLRQRELESIQTCLKRHISSVKGCKEEKEIVKLRVEEQ